MICKCGHLIDIKLASKVEAIGCNILTSMTTIVTAECLNCHEKFQVPITSKDYIIRDKN